MGSKENTAITLVVLVLIVIIIYYVWKNFKNFSTVESGLSNALGNLGNWFNQGTNALASSAQGAEKSFANAWNDFATQYLNKPILPVVPPLTRTSIDNILNGGAQGTTTSGTDTPNDTSQNQTSASDIGTEYPPVDVIEKSPASPTVQQTVTVTVNGGQVPTVSQVPETSSPVVNNPQNTVDPSNVVSKILNAANNAASNLKNSLDAGTGSASIKPVSTTTSVFPQSSTIGNTDVPNPLDNAPVAQNDIIAELQKAVGAVFAAPTVTPSAPVIEGVSVG
jgi:hypothetical protein